MDNKQAILVTGSAGLIGACLVEQLRARGEKVLELDSRLLMNHPGYGDFCRYEHLSTKLSQSKGVIHLAGISRVVWGEKNPQKCWDVNVLGTEQLLEALYQSPHRPWIIYGSSREVYGQQKKLPVNEKNSLAPLNIYAKSKVAAENLMSDFSQQGLMTAILRFSSVYGSIDDHVDRVIPAFCRNAVLGRPLRVEGLHNQFDFTHVHDTVKGIIALMSLIEKGVGNLPPMHLTTGIGTRLFDVIKLLEQIVGHAISYYEAPARTYDVQRFYADSTCAQTLLCWQPKISLFEGIKNLVQQYQQHVSLLPNEAWPA